MNQFFNYIADNCSHNETVSDFETTCKIKDEDRLTTAKPMGNNNHYFDEAITKYQLPVRDNAQI